GFFAAETTTHAAADTDDLVLPKPQAAGDDRLDLRRVLGGRVDGNLTTFTGNGQRGLRLEIKVLLPATGKRSLENMLGVRKGGGNAPALNAPRRTDELLAGKGVFDGEHGGQFVELDTHGHLGHLHSRFACAGQHDDRLADIVAHFLGQKLFVVKDRAKGIL